MPTLYSCAACKQLFPRQGRESRCPRCAPYGWPKTAPMSPGWTQLRKQKLQANPTCERCGQKATTVDHIKARAFGGSDAWQNLRSLCRICAAKKDHQDREQGKKRRD